MKRLFATLVVFAAVVSASFAIDVDRKELEPGDAGKAIEFINYTGPHSVIETVEQIKGIGIALGARAVKDGSAGDQARYYVIHARAGQKMYLAFLGRGHLRGGITYPNGSGDGPFVSGQTVLDLPQTGDYIIYLGQHTMADEAWTGRFTLSVMVQ